MLFLEFLAVGAWGFWALIAISAIIMSELVDTDNPGWATVTAVATVAILSGLGNFNPLVWIHTNPADVAFCVAAYFVLGAMWGVVKWYFWLQKTKRMLIAFNNEHPSWKEDDLAHAIYVAGIGGDFPPNVSYHKAKIMGWMMLWPASMVWTMLNDPVRRIFEEIYDRIGGGLQAMSDRVFRDFKVTRD
jgi:hypothetical protein